MNDFINQMALKVARQHTDSKQHPNAPRKEEKQVEKNVGKKPVSNISTPVQQDISQNKDAYFKRKPRQTQKLQMKSKGRQQSNQVSAQKLPEQNRFAKNNPYQRSKIQQPVQQKTKLQTYKAPVKSAIQPEVAQQITQKPQRQVYNPYKKQVAKEQPNQPQKPKGYPYNKKQQQTETQFQTKPNTSSYYQKPQNPSPQVQRPKPQQYKSHIQPQPQQSIKKNPYTKSSIQQPMKQQKPKPYIAPTSQSSSQKGFYDPWSSQTKTQPPSKTQSSQLQKEQIKNSEDNKTTHNANKKQPFKRQNPSPVPERKTNYNPYKKELVEKVDTIQPQAQKPSSKAVNPYPYQKSRTQQSKITQPEHQVVKIQPVKPERQVYNPYKKTQSPKVQEKVQQQKRYPYSKKNSQKSQLSSQPDKKIYNPYQRPDKSPVIQRPKPKINKDQINQPVVQSLTINVKAPYKQKMGITSAIDQTISQFKAKGSNPNTDRQSAKQQEKKVPSNMLIYVLPKFVNITVQKVFAMLKQNYIKNRNKQNFANILGNASINIYNYKQINNKLEVFKRLKLNFFKLLKKQQLQRKRASKSRVKPINKDKMIEDIKQKIQQVKDNMRTEQKQYQENLDDMRSIFSQNNVQVNIQTQNNQELKEILNKLSSVEDIERDQTEQKLSILTDIYIDVMKQGQSNQNQISINELINNYGIQLSQDQHMRNHEILIKHTNLKMKIEAIQNLQMDRKSANILGQQYKIIENLVRSYVKQRYLWEWLRRSLPR